MLGYRGYNVGNFCHCLLIFLVSRGEIFSLKKIEDNFWCVSFFFVRLVTRLIIVRNVSEGMVKMYRLSSREVRCGRPRLAMLSRDTSSSNI